MIIIKVNDLTIELTARNERKIKQLLSRFPCHTLLSIYNDNEFLEKLKICDLFDYE
jgi:hypothetical protein